MAYNRGRHHQADKILSREDVTRIVTAPSAEEYLEEHPQLKLEKPKAKVLQQN